MGNDLHYIQTPNAVEETLGGLHHSTWVFLSNFYGREEKEEMDGMELDQSSLDTLKAISLTAKHCNNPLLVEDIHELMLAIKKYESITLVVRG